MRSPLGKRPNLHALPPAIPAMVYLGIPADAELIKAVMRGILTAICAKSAEPLRVLDRRNLPAPSEVGLYPPLFKRHNHALPAAATTATLRRRAKAKPIDDASERKRQSGTSDHRVLLSDTNIAASSMPPECVGRWSAPLWFQIEQLPGRWARLSLQCPSHVPEETGTLHARATRRLASALTACHMLGHGRLPAEANAQGRCHRSGDRRNFLHSVGRPLAGLDAQGDNLTVIRTLIAGHLFEEVDCLSEINHELDSLHTEITQISTLIAIKQFDVVSRR